jgi:hypothetical protein
MSGNHQGRMKANERQQQIVDLWRQRPKERRTHDDVLTFYGWLSEHESELVPDEPGSYQKLHTVLGNYLLGPR